ncbi:hypothetical protein VTN77DRAFT_1805 [Rasamsonia byssochlamydoides]|uniref:uncharacterized protein n=1 Tax=Rasamsonia byssochlamydoides TaxID=89139 RepID=UPI00374277B0
MASDQQEEIVGQNDAKTSKDRSTASDDAGERPVRKKLRQTKITPDSNVPVGDDSGNSSDDSSDRGRLQKKRSFEDLQAENQDGTSTSKGDGGHRRKRSRDSKDDDDVNTRDRRDSTPSESPRNGEEVSKQILSPKKKRSIDQLENDDVKEEQLAGQEGDKNAVRKVSGDKTKAEGERETKRHRDASQERKASSEGEAVSSKPLPSAFLNTSAVSPFASLASSKSPAPGDAKTEDAAKSTHVTSASAFASSSLASFAGSEQSPFGALGSSNTTSVFKSTSSASSEQPASTGFAAAAGPSPFATTGASGFATLGSGFGGSAFGSGFAAAGKLGGGLSSFASPSGPSVLGGSSEVKPLGASGGGSDEENEEDDGKPVEGFEKEKEDERFFAQEIETGEEGEKTYFSCKAKLFHFTGGEWKERGVGTFKVNVREPEDPEKDKTTARMIMRADGVLRVMLNTPIFKGMTVGDVSGQEPKGKQLNLLSLEEGRSVPLLLRVGNADLAKELYHVVRDLQQRL